MAAEASTPVLTFVTGNKKKLEEVQRILKEAKVPFDITNKSLDLPELQGEPEEVALEKCKLAAKEVNGPVFCEDTSLCFNALGGLPGVYIKWFLAKLGHDGLNKMLAAYEDKSAYAQCIFAFTPGPHEEPQVFVGRVPGHIVPPRGPTDFGWDPVFEPDTEHKQTYAEMDAAVKSTLSHRAVALGKLCAHLRENSAQVSAAAAGAEPAPAAASSAAAQ